MFIFVVASLMLCMVTDTHIFLYYTFSQLFMEIYGVHVYALMQSAVLSTCGTGGILFMLTGMLTLANISQKKISHLCNQAHLSYDGKLVSTTTGKLIYGVKRLAFRVNPELTLSKLTLFKNLVCDLPFPPNFQG